MSKEKFKIVRELIDKREYDEARAVLLTMGTNPTAQKWLARLEEISPTPPAPETFIAKRSEVEAANAPQPTAAPSRRGGCGCFMGGCLTVLALTCVVVVGLPGAYVYMASRDMPQVDRINERVIQWASNNDAFSDVSTTLLSGSAEQLAPIIEQSCEASDLPPELYDTCTEMVTDMVQCSGENDMTTCMDNLTAALCVSMNEGNPQQQQACIESMSGGN